MPNYTEILERLKQARGESFELDVAIAEATDGNMNPVPGYTRSLDASVALVERALPPMSVVKFTTYIGGKFHRAYIEDGETADISEANNAPTLPLAILIALFEALEAREQGI